MSCWTETIIHLVSCLEFFVFGCWSFLIGGTQWNNHGFSSFHENISRFISSLRNLRIEYVILPIKWIFSSLLNETFENSLNEYNINQLRFSIFDLWSCPGLLFSRWMDHCYKERKLPFGKLFHGNWREPRALYTSKSSREESICRF